MVERLQEGHLLDDAQFSAYWAQNRQQFSPRGDRAIRYELRLKGLDAGLIDAAVSDLPKESERALAAGRKKLNSLRRLDDAEFHRKLIAYLSRRGFGYSDARAAADVLSTERARLE